MHQTLNAFREKLCGDQRYIRLSLCMECCAVGRREGPTDHILECRAEGNQRYVSELLWPQG